MKPALFYAVAHYSLKVVLILSLLRGLPGVDYDNCFFHDPNEPMAQGRGKKNGRHRKIVQYVTYPGALAGDEAEGHGTHVVKLHFDLKSSNARPTDVIV